MHCHSLLRSTFYTTLLLAADLFMGCGSFRHSSLRDRLAAEHYMRFRIEDQEFESFDPNEDPSDRVIDLDPMPHALVIDSQAIIRSYFRDADSNAISMEICLPSLATGTYVLTDTLHCYQAPVVSGVKFVIGRIDKTSLLKRRYYRTSSAARGTVTIDKYDTLTRQLSGTFRINAELYGSRPAGEWPEKLVITDGAFQITRAPGPWSDNPFR